MPVHGRRHVSVFWFFYQLLFCFVGLCLFAQSASLQRVVKYQAMSNSAGIDDSRACASFPACTCAWRRRSRWPPAVTAACRTWRCWAWWRCGSRTTRTDASASSSATTTTKGYSCRCTPGHSSLSFSVNIVNMNPTQKLVCMFVRWQAKTMVGLVM